MNVGRCAPGFTLVELLVVVTLIAVLMALIAPALDKAIYAAELARCGGALRATGAGIIMYAMNNKHRYPLRGLDDVQKQGTTYQYSFIAATALTDRTYGQFDSRPYIKDFIQINKQLVDPMCLPVDLEQDKGPDENVAASYTLWWGWKYQDQVVSSTTGTIAVPGQTGTAGTGMYKLGDRWSFMGESFRLLAGDYDLNLGGGDANPLQGSHDDYENRFNAYAFKYQPLFGTPAGIPITVSLYMHQGNVVRAPIDMNHLYDDMAVARFTAVKGWVGPSDERMTRVRNMANSNQGWKYYQVPKK